MRKKLLIGISVALVALLVRLFFGVYIHDEFGEENFFIKYRPTWKWKFYSPIGQSDLRLKDLSPEEQIEQKDFDEFVRSQGLSR